MEKTLQELATLVDGRVIGDASIVITETRSFEQAVKQSITFAVGEYVEHIALCQAGAVIVESEVTDAPMAQIVVDNAKAAFAQVLELFHPPVVVPREVHSTAIIGENVTIGKNVSIGAYCVINDNAVIGFATENGVHTHIPQVGNVILEDDVEIGSCTTIDNATMGSTLVRRGTKIDNLVHLGHNVEIGEDCFLIAQVGIAGSTKCGNHVIFAGQTGCTGHITIGDNVQFAGKTGITGNVPSNSIMAGYPMRPHKEWLKLAAYENRLPDMVKTVKQLQKEIDALKAQLKES